MTSVPSIDTFKLELARPGPLYGQLLSKLTNYMALCDGVEADTFQLPFAHYEIEADIEGLRYFVNEAGAVPVPNAFRAMSLQRLSNRLNSTFDQMRGFQTRFAEGSCADLTHLRLILNGSELSLVPFEVSIVPYGWRGSGAKLLLQSRARTVLTRELRDSCRYRVEWNREPRVLFCTASPEGFSPPPALAHLVALLRAVQPWSARNQTGEWGREKEEIVTVVADASLDSIARATAARDYTHVHILAHGCDLKHQRDRYGLALAKDRNPAELEIVDAAALAHALWGRHPGKKPPTMVTLASCDSGNQSGVVSPGSSVAHELHHEGVPWVVASQMPLTYRGSTTLTRTLYAGLFAGEDPRWVLHQVRGELARNPEAHDWAALVVYAAFPHDFEAQISAFAIRQIHCLINSAFSRAEKQCEGCADEFRVIEKHLARRERLLPPRRGRNDADRSEFLGMRGAICKQQAVLLHGEKAKERLREGADFYRQAAEQHLGNHWVVIQYLSLSTLLGLEIKPGWFELAECTAALDFEDPGERAWAAGSLLELALLRHDGKALGKRYTERASEFAKSVPSKRSFACFSTIRQLKRYNNEGGFAEHASAQLKQRAQEALEEIDRRVRD